MLLPIISSKIKYAPLGEYALKGSVPGYLIFRK